MKKLLVLIFLITTFCFSFAQNPKIDSLLTLLKTDKEDANRVNILSQLTHEYEITGDYEKGLSYGKEAIELSLKLNLKKETAEVHNNVGSIFLKQGDYPKALDHLFNALKIDEAHNDKKGTAAQLCNIGVVYYDLGDYPKALDYDFKALKLLKELEDKNRVAAVLGNIGGVYNDQGDYPKALDYDFKALKTFQEVEDKNSSATILGNIANVYYEQKDYRKALDYYYKALKMAEEVGDRNGMARHLGNIGVFYTEQPTFPPPSTEDKKGYALAEKYLLDALEIDKEIGARDDEKQYEEQLSTLYEKMGRYQPALDHYKKTMALKDTLFSEENKKQMIKKEMNFEFEKKVALTKAESDKQAAVAKEEKQKQQIVIYAVAGVLLLVIVFSIFLFNRFLITNRQKAIIEQQKEQVGKAYEQLHEKNKEVMDSINYASRIQRALLPSQKYIVNQLNRLMKSNSAIKKD